MRDNLFLERTMRPGKVHVDRKAAMGGRDLVAAKEPAQRRKLRAGRENRAALWCLRFDQGVSACGKLHRILGHHGVSSRAISRREGKNSMNSSLMGSPIAANTARNQLKCEGFGATPH
jgi:hypothetical protein